MLGGADDACQAPASDRGPADAAGHDAGGGAGSRAHDDGVMPMGHCDPRGAGTTAQKRGIAECTMACSAALPAADLADDAPLPIDCAPALPAPRTHFMASIRKPATPPPKVS